jgi:hypothetical protein
MVVYGFECDSDVISKTLGVTATDSWRRGERVNPRVINVRHENGWAVHSPADAATSTLESSVAALLSQFSDPDAFQRLPAGSRAQVTCVIYAYKERPIVFLPASLIRRIGEFGADLDIDIYDLTSLEDSTGDAPT